MTTLEIPDADIAAHECRGDFWLMFREAIVAAHGQETLCERLQDKPLEEVVELLAQNGLRMVYLPEKHINSLTKR